ncbi:MAG: hypothetical protein C6Y22_26415 [Hapalosiphonaceae cyanobacterium JJU2]|nr:MAG: hypothetical protein C6Y22_26415 [Hapalosiphonaceae cyanobacterium JJU2]
MFAVRYTYLPNANLSNANLSNVNLHKTLYNKRTKLPNNFEPTQKQMLLIAPGVNLSGADLSGVDFGNADFQGINLTNANLENSILWYVKNLTPEQVKAAKNWDKAKYNEEFKKKLGLKLYKGNENGESYLGDVVPRNFESE